MATHTMATVHHFLDYWAREQPDAEFAVQGNQRLTYGEAASAVNRLAQGIIHSGIEAGERMGFLAWNRPECVLLYFAASKAGVVMVPLDPRQTPNQWAYALNDSQVKLLFCAGEFVPAINELREELGAVERFVSLDDADPGDGWENWRRWLEQESPTPIEQPVAGTAALVQIYTSGTTGLPKGVPLSHSGLMVEVTAFDLVFKGRPGERWLIVSPLFHNSAILVAFHSVYSGGSLYIMRAFDPQEVVRAFSEENIAGTIVTPSMLHACLTAVPDVAERRYDSLRVILYAGEAIAEGTFRQAIDVFKCDFVQTYAATEAGLMTLLGPRDHRRAVTDKPVRLTSAGRPTPWTELRIVDEEGQPVPTGTIGEIVVRGPQVMMGYWNRPEETAKALRDGWFYTGDAGLVDDEGYLCIRDRIKDLIVTSGRNVYPVMVENVLNEHPFVAEAAVIGVPDQETGEAVKAVIILRDGAVADERELIEFCAGKLGEYQRPTSVDFVDTFPRNSMRKVLKGVLREPYWAGHDRQVGGT